MLEVQHVYGGRHFKLHPYTTSQEKDLLLLGTIGEENLDVALRICKVHQTTIDDLSFFEKLAYLYKLREVSVGSEMSVKFTCKHCKVGSENSIDIEHIIKNPENTSELIKDQYTKITDSNLHTYLGKSEEFVQNLEINEFTKLRKMTERNCVDFNFKCPVRCQQCRKTNHINIESAKFCIDVMSEDSLVSLYQSYNDLIFFGTYSKLDVDSMYPFERTILTQMLNKTREDLNNA